MNRIVLTSSFVGYRAENDHLRSNQYRSHTATEHCNKYPTTVGFSSSIIDLSVLAFVLDLKLNDTTRRPSLSPIQQAYGAHLGQGMSDNRERGMSTRRDFQVTLLLPNKSGNRQTGT